MDERKDRRMKKSEKGNTKIRKGKNERKKKEKYCKKEMKERKC